MGLLGLRHHVHRLQRRPGVLLEIEGRMAIRETDIGQLQAVPLIIDRLDGLSASSHLMQVVLPASTRVDVEQRPVLVSDGGPLQVVVLLPNLIETPARIVIQQARLVLLNY